MRASQRPRAAPRPASSPRSLPFIIFHRLLSWYCCRLTFIPSPAVQLRRQVAPDRPPVDRAAVATVVPRQKAVKDDDRRWSQQQCHDKDDGRRWSRQFRQRMNGREMKGREKSCCCRLTWWSAAPSAAGSPGASGQLRSRWPRPLRLTASCQRCGGGEGSGAVN